MKRIPFLVGLWHRIKECPFFIKFYIVRLFGWMIFPLVGVRAPLLGFHKSTKRFLEGGRGTYIELEPLPNDMGLTSPDEKMLVNFVAIIPSGRSVFNCGAVVTPDHRLLTEVSWQDAVLDESEPLHNSAMRKWRLPKLAYVRGSVAVLSSVKCQNYYHWMFDILPRFEILRRSGQSVDYYLVNLDTSFQRESLQLIGIPSEKIISPTAVCHIRADRLIVPSLPGPLFGQTPYAQACAFLRSEFLRNVKKSLPTRLLYLSRRDAEERRVLNEEEVIETILAMGFEIKNLSEIPFIEQVELFSQATVILGPHGAGFSNAVFCCPGTSLIEFMPREWGVDCFKNLASRIPLDYHVIDCDGGSGTPALHNTYDHVVDISVLKQVLQEVLVCRQTGTGNYLNHLEKD